MFFVFFVVISNGFFLLVIIVVVVVFALQYIFGSLFNDNDDAGSFSFFVSFAFCRIIVCGIRNNSIFLRGGRDGDNK